MPALLVLSQVDPARLLRLLDFMTQQGWVRQPAAAGQQH